MHETTHMTDAKAFIGWLDKQASVARTGKWARRAIAWAGRSRSGRPRRCLIAWPPLPRSTAADWSEARPKTAIAANDDARSPKEKDILKETFEKAKLAAEIEVYADSAHGWCPPDSRVYSEPLAEKAWSRLLALYGKTLA